MIYLLIAYDPSAGAHPEVKRAMEFYERKNKIYKWSVVFDLLRKDNGWRNTFNETGSDLNRRLASSVTINYQTNAESGKL